MSQQPENYMRNQELVTMSNGMQAHAKRLARMQKIPKPLKVIVKRMAAGTVVAADDALDALAHCLNAATTAASTSPERRMDGQAAMSLWNEVRKQTSAHTDWEDAAVPAVPAWEAPDLSSVDAVEEYLTT